ncbi:MAG: dTDP-glucose 4,6-dehydratase [Patescibacteria group bacterium]|nr:dTDP-glucose 4,6-dehydratase [Patescibacteria group bacterium]MDD5715124.1 dTDP-glucose 4,6-dehydratase [Patescibacteria group bacterium]
MKLLITGGAGFIGSNFIRYWLDKHPDDHIVNLDALTYCGNRMNLVDIDKNHQGYHRLWEFDITCPLYTEQAGNEPDTLKKSELYGRFDRESFSKLVEEVSRVDTIVHFAAESHVDRSVLNANPLHPIPFDFIQTNVWGTHIMLEAAVKAWRKPNGKYDSSKRFHHVSTDEVFGALTLKARKKFNEKTKYNPRSPYAASKAASDLIVRAYRESFSLPVTISNTSNNYGPYMYPEKLLPLAITNLLENKKVPIYGDGKYVRDWLYVLDHCQGIELILQKGKPGETYCLGGLTDDVNNLALIKKVLAIMGKDESSIEFVKDRPGHDRRYAIDWTYAHQELGYQPKHDLDTYLRKMIEWYRSNEQWWRPIKSGEFYKDYYRRQYELR